MKFTLSPSKLNVLRECPRCFYDINMNGIARPRGPFPSLPGGIDIVMKKYLANYCGSLPPILTGEVPGKLYADAAKLKRWQFWRTAPMFEDKGLDVAVYGAIDNLLVQVDNSVDPLDVKTKGSEPKTDGSEYYQLQMDIYNLLFSVNGFKVNNRAFLLYLYPALACEEIKTIKEEMPADQIVMLFKRKVFEIKCSTDRARETIKTAVDILNGPRPESSPDCEYCNWLNLTTGIK
ncbi:MAG TPA: PD-(D/E)XK nuclease family protein [Candidatus Omnitrophota bacterium]|nr:PD-(D/E)XK nuclease family protein [Candidatus Omnitrophota bacterium]